MKSQESNTFSIDFDTPIDRAETPQRNGENTKERHTSSLGSGHGFPLSEVVIKALQEEWHTAYSATPIRRANLWRSCVPCFGIFIHVSRT